MTKSIISQIVTPVLAFIGEFPPVKYMFSLVLSEEIHQYGHSVCNDYLSTRCSEHNGNEY